ncbi:MAG: ABC transporter substrate-binding protein [Natronospirillum sp.]|uniref:ABC transporter substrate-binding protein n=1 Tax=Natronospirillum sp. TaxID=2812955 RepID=UPI0025F07718|nr:ABC transporter substrate-binding protein [Natronospirillum sp.]MCH8553126.1 ABC transporter substrate-binding protein [Natronospirillum sp.]
MKKALIGVTIAAASVLGTAQADDVKVGFLGGFTGAIESLVPPIYDGAQLAVQHVNDQGGILGGRTLVMPSGDTACGDAAITQSSADRLINSENVTAIVGALCSGATIAAANNVAVPAGVVMVSPASTSPALTDLDDNDLVFRTVPSDAFQGEAMGNLLISKGIQEVALAYVNNDYGRGLADAFEATFEAQGGMVTARAGHEDNRADYRADLANLSAGGSETLVVMAYADGSGQTMLRQAWEGGFFTQFVGGDGMVGSGLITAVGADAMEGTIFTRPGTLDVPGTAVFEELAEGTDVNADGTFVSQSYDAAFLLALAIEYNGHDGREGLNEALRAVATAPGETILPGEWEKARELIAAGEPINYVGASGDHEFDDAGDVPGAVEEMVVENGSIVSQGFVGM